jgi:hypothetical protein
VSTIREKISDTIRFKRRGFSHHGKTFSTKNTNYPRLENARANALEPEAWPPREMHELILKETFFDLSPTWLFPAPGENTHSERRITKTKAH